MPTRGHRRLLARAKQRPATTLVNEVPQDKLRRIPIGRQPDVLSAVTLGLRLVRGFPLLLCHLCLLSAVPRNETSHLSPLFKGGGRLRHWLHPPVRRLSSPCLGEKSGPQTYKYPRNFIRISKEQPEVILIQHLAPRTSENTSTPRAVGWIELATSLPARLRARIAAQPQRTSIGRILYSQRQLAARSRAGESDGTCRSSSPPSALGLGPTDHSSPVDDNRVSRSDCSASVRRRPVLPPLLKRYSHTRVAVSWQGGQVGVLNSVLIWASSFRHSP